MDAKRHALVSRAYYTVVVVGVPSILTETSDGVEPYGVIRGNMSRGSQQSNRRIWGWNLWHRPLDPRQSILVGFHSRSTSCSITHFWDSIFNQCPVDGRLLRCPFSIAATLVFFASEFASPAFILLIFARPTRFRTYNPIYLSHSVIFFPGLRSCGALSLCLSFHPPAISLKAESANWFLRECYSHPILQHITWLYCLPFVRNNGEQSLSQ